MTAASIPAGAAGTHKAQFIDTLAAVARSPKWGSTAITSAAGALNVAGVAQRLLDLAHAAPAVQDPDFQSRWNDHRDKVLDPFIEAGFSEEETTARFLKTLAEDANAEAEWLTLAMRAAGRDKGFSAVGFKVIQNRTRDLAVLRRYYLSDENERTARTLLKAVNKVSSDALAERTDHAQRLAESLLAAMKAEGLPVGALEPWQMAENVLDWKRRLEPYVQVAHPEGAPPGGSDALLVFPEIPRDSQRLQKLVIPEEASPSLVHAVSEAILKSLLPQDRAFVQYGRWTHDWEGERLRHGVMFTVVNARGVVVRGGDFDRFMDKPGWIVLTFRQSPSEAVIESLRINGLEIERTIDGKKLLARPTQ